MTAGERGVASAAGHLVFTIGGRSSFCWPFVEGRAGLRGLLGGYLGVVRWLL